jgi:hypothetical protein
MTICTRHIFTAEKILTQVFSSRFKKIGRIGQICPRFDTKHFGLLLVRSELISTRAHQKGGLPGRSPPSKRPKQKLKKHIFCRYYDIKCLTWFPLHPKSATEVGWWIRILQNKLIKLKKKEDRALWLSHGTLSFSCMYINSVAKSVMLHLQHNFYNTNFKITHTLYIASGSAPPPPPRKNSGCALESVCTSKCTVIRYVGSSKENNFSRGQENGITLLLVVPVTTFWFRTTN